MKQSKNKVVLWLLCLSLLAACGGDSGTAQSSVGTESSNTEVESSSPEADAPEDGGEGSTLLAFEAGSVVQDPSGNEFIVPESMDRIISTAPSNTEILVALGLGDKIMVVDTYSQGIEGLPTDVMAVEFRSPDAESLIMADCDILFASEHNMEGGEDPYAQLTEAGIEVVYIPTSETLTDIYADILFFGQLTGQVTQAEGVVADMKATVQTVTETLAGVETKDVYFEISPAPYLYTFGTDTFLHEMLELAGGNNVFSSEQGWFAPSEEAILMADPEIIITNAGYMDDAVGEIISRENWTSLQAVVNEDVYLVDENLLARPSQNVVLGLEELARTIHPDLF